MPPPGREPFPGQKQAIGVARIEKLVPLVPQRLQSRHVGDSSTAIPRPSTGASVNVAVIMPPVIPGSVPGSRCIPPAMDRRPDESAVPAHAPSDIAPGTARPFRGGTDFVPELHGSDAAPPQGRATACLSRTSMGKNSGQTLHPGLPAAWLPGLAVSAANAGSFPSAFRGCAHNPVA